LALEQLTQLESDSQQQQQQIQLQQETVHGSSERQRDINEKDVEMN